MLLIPAVEILEDAKACEASVCSWGKANGVTFEPTKESFGAISRSIASEGWFKYLGIHFDTKLTMDSEIDRLVTMVEVKLWPLLRNSRFFTHAQTIRLYKAHP